MTSPSLTDALIFIEEADDYGFLRFGTEETPHKIRDELKKIPGIGKIFFVLPASYRGPLSGDSSIILAGQRDDVVFWKDMFSKTSAGSLVKIFGDSPFFDPAIIVDMIDLHVKYLAEFTYSENLPAGCSCEVYSRELIDRLPDFDKETLNLAKVIKTNINQFDIELYYREPDLRDKRISFRSSLPRDRKIMERIAGIHGSIPRYGELQGIIDGHPEVLCPGPSYLELELTGACDLDCVFCYRKNLKEPRGEMSRALLDTILAGMESFGLPYTVCFGGSGEPLQHPAFYSFAEKVLESPLVERLVVETNGILTDGSYVSLLEHPQAKKIITIVNLNGTDGTTYAALHGTDAYSRVTANIDRIREIKTAAQLFVQLLKINETEEFTDTYYDIWEGKGVPVIFQKQNSFCGVIKDRRYSDLSPLVRAHCWHLARDLYVTADGSVTFCKQDFSGTFSADKIGDREIGEIWNGRIGRFVENYRQNFPIQPDCKNCDEWYTFNY